MVCERRTPFILGFIVAAGMFIFNSALTLEVRWYGLICTIILFLKVEAGKEDCFYQDIQLNVPIKMEVMVFRGGLLDIDLNVSLYFHLNDFLYSLK